MLKKNAHINAIPGRRTQRPIEALFNLSENSSLPAQGSVGYPNGFIFNLTDPISGQAFQWINIGTEGSATFVPVGPVNGYGIVVAGGPVTSVGGDTAESIALQGLIMDSDIAFAGHEVSNDNDQIAAVIANEGSIDLTLSADPLPSHGYVYAGLRDKCTPDFDIIAAGTHTTVGGAAAEAITVTGVLATDIAFACYSATDDTDTISKVVCTADTVTVTMSADPSTTHGLHYVVLRPRGTFKPSHHIFNAGVHTTVGGDATEVITVAGATANDVALVVFNTTNDTDTILKSVLTANTLTVTLSADPSTAHKLAWMVLRAY